MIEGAGWRKWVFFYVPMALFLLFLLFPFYWMVITSVRPDGELYRPWNSINYNPFWTWKPTWDHVRYLFEETLFASWLWNTTFIALVSTAISLVCGVFAGYALSRLSFPFAGSLGTAIFITYLVPQTLLFIPLAEIIRNYRLGDTPWSLILTYPTFLIPFCTWLMMGYFKAVPKELEECARIDGASRWQAMLYIVIPVAIPGILSAGIFAFTLSWNEFIYALVFLSSPEQKTVPVGVTSELILLGAADGRRPARIDPGRHRLFVLRRALRRGIDRIGEGLKGAEAGLKTAHAVCARWEAGGAHGTSRPQGDQQVLRQRARGQGRQSADPRQGVRGVRRAVRLRQDHDAPDDRRA
jgi:multiple sugar transport system permease protein